MLQSSKLFLNKKIIKEVKEELLENAKFDEEVSKVLNKFSCLSNFSKEKQVYWFKRALFLLLTARNRQLITLTEQEKLKDTVVAFFGLSVGSHAALTWMMLSRADKIKISDPDIISPTNLNRLRFGWNTIGKLKADIVKKRLREINPYCEVYKFTQVEERIVRKIILSEPKPQVVVDCMDDLKSKVLVRLLARKRKIPVLMATDVGDNVFLDIERYDKLPLPRLFNGRVEDIEKIDLSKLSDPERIKLSMQIVGFEHNSERMLKSLLSIGKTIKTWPQLGSTATIAGGLITTLVKKMVLRERVKSGRYYFSIDKLLVYDYDSKKRKKKKEQLSDEIAKKIF
ncbi:hypothetical protein A2892_03930 [Candidatus Woesebacteria bacterium RIFCSPLOWO2_01_FULL_39_10b]|uniref:THIF-type NAD/FAD binding fold domain-containing protein n=1 Tax=Candidatus Woesebacteria bacterium RIFCSPLOWO2_01_FULL_39_10b TaxID=1802517 RepID=A0A1F8B6L6_9BACT|nr:MAG: hypothetical protein A2892_03930 [Candidatus Woesebacteria bacterium RIFCSPLOWO2_01_FULL_39_10b]